MTISQPKPLISVVVPVHNEVEAVPVFFEAMEALAEHSEEINLELVFVDDGSTDETVKLIQTLKSKLLEIKLVELTRNFGKEAALSAGLAVARGDAVIPMDADLQDPPALIPEMVRQWQAGYDVVLAVRKTRSSDSWAKRASASWFYKIHNKIAEPAIPENVGDFRLMDKKVVQVLNQLPESRRFMKGLFAWVGFKTTTLAYDRPERAAGESKFNGWKLWNFALEGLTSFSISPLRIWTYIGSLVALASFIFALYIAIKVIVLGVEVPGYASVVVAVTMLGGLQLVGIGILGEYLGRAYLESKRRPVYLIRKIHVVTRDESSL